MKKLYLHAVVIDKKLGLYNAKKKAREILQRRQIQGYKESEESYRFGAIPKTMFDPTSFRSKKIDENITIVFGHLKEDEEESKD